jgi:hypothetical protein
MDCFWGKTDAILSFYDFFARYCDFIGKFSQRSPRNQFEEPVFGVN